MRLKLRIWRQNNNQTPGKLVDYDLDDVSEDSSFLEMLDLLNEELIDKGEEPVAFDHDCREGICGMCGLVINGIAHGPKAATTTCQLHMRVFKDGDTITVEPWRAKAIPDPEGPDGRPHRVRPHRPGRRLHLGRTPAAAPDANAIPVPKEKADRSMDAAACIGCGACVAACPNSSAMLFTPPSWPISTRCRRASPNATTAPC